MQIGDRITRADGRAWDNETYVVTGLNTHTGAVYAELETDKYIRDLTIPRAKFDEWTHATAEKQQEYECP